MGQELGLISAALLRIADSFPRRAVRNRAYVGRYLEVYSNKHENANHTNYCLKSLNSTDGS